MNDKKLYIAGMGMITALGPSVATTVAAVRAGKSAYQLSEYETEEGDSIVVSQIPHAVFDVVDATINEGDRFNLRHDRMIKMAIIAAREACLSHTTDQAIPLVVGISDRDFDKDGLSSLIENLQENCRPWISAQLSRSVFTGRAAGITAIDFAYRYLYELNYPFVLVGASESFMDDELINLFMREQRLLAQGSSDAFVLGEAASFLLLTKYAEFAETHNGPLLSHSL